MSDEDSSHSTVIVVKVHDRKLIKLVKSALELLNYINKQCKIQKDGSIYTNISTTTDNTDTIPSPFANTELEKLHSAHPNEIQFIAAQPIGEPRRLVQTSLPNSIESFFRNYIKSHGLQLRNDQLSLLMLCLPKKWSIYPPMVLFNSHTFDDSVWQRHFFAVYSVKQSDFFKSLLEHCFANTESPIDRIAINKPIPLLSNETSSNYENIKRIPLNISSIYGDFGPLPTLECINSPTAQDFEDAFWCHAKQNNIYQYWAPRYIMFSRGNVKEKLRIIQTFANIEGNDIVDLYAGIGYFTLCYLAKQCRKIYSWELNPWSVQGLVKGCEKNKFKYQVIKAKEPWNYDPNARIYIFNESNEFAPQRFVELSSYENSAKFDGLKLTHINLGLLPTSKPSWSISADLIKNFRDDGTKETVVHVHENVKVTDFDAFIQSTKACLEKLLLEKGAGNNQLTVKPMVEFMHLEKIKTFAPDVWHICVDYNVY